MARNKKPKPLKKETENPNARTLILIAVIGAIATVLAATIPALVPVIVTQKPPVETEFATMTFTQSLVSTATDFLFTDTPQSISTSAGIDALTSTPVPNEITDAGGAQMVLVPAGEFTMGSNNGYDNEQPVHQVYLNDFYIDKYEVSNTLYRVCVNAGVCQLPAFTNSFSRPDYFVNLAFDNYPVIFVNWDMASDYCSWRGAKLPTEAQWEKAARGEDGNKYPWGSVFDEDRGNICDKNCPESYAEKNFDDGYIDTSPIGSFEGGKSPYGVYDMAGNVWEWVADWYSESYYERSPLSDPLGPTSGEYRVLRGSAWNYFSDYARSSARFWRPPANSYSAVGFRCAKAPTP